MANWSDLKAAVASIVKTNGNKEITGQLLQNVLNNIISNVGLNSSFAGIATPETNPGTPDGNVFYLATTAGTYPNFNGIVINSGEAVILEWKGSWVKKDSGFSTQEKLSEITSEVEKEKAMTFGVAAKDKRYERCIQYIGFDIPEEKKYNKIALCNFGIYAENQNFYLGFFDFDERARVGYNVSPITQMTGVQKIEMGTLLGQEASYKISNVVIYIDWDAYENDMYIGANVDDVQVKPNLSYKIKKLEETTLLQSEEIAKNKTVIKSETPLLFVPSSNIPSNAKGILDVKLISGTLPSDMELYLYYLTNGDSETMPRLYIKKGYNGIIGAPSEDIVAMSAKTAIGAKKGIEKITTEPYPGNKDGLIFEIILDWDAISFDSSAYACKFNRSAIPFTNYLRKAGTEAGFKKSLFPFLRADADTTLLSNVGFFGFQMRDDGTTYDTSTLIISYIGYATGWSSIEDGFYIYVSANNTPNDANVVSRCFVPKSKIKEGIMTLYGTPSKDSKLSFIASVDVNSFKGLFLSETTKLPLDWEGCKYSSYGALTKSMEWQAKGIIPIGNNIENDALPGILDIKLLYDRDRYLEQGGKVYFWAYGIKTETDGRSNRYMYIIKEAYVDFQSSVLAYSSVRTDASMVEKAGLEQFILTEVNNSGLSFIVTVDWSKVKLAGGSIDNGTRVQINPNIPLAIADSAKKTYFIEGNSFLRRIPDGFVLDMKRDAEPNYDKLALWYVNNTETNRAIYIGKLNSQNTYLESSAAIYAMFTASGQGKGVEDVVLRPYASNGGNTTFYIKVNWNKVPLGFSTLGEKPQWFAALNVKNIPYITKEEEVGFNVLNNLPILPSQIFLRDDQTMPIFKNSIFTITDNIEKVDVGLICNVGGEAQRIINIAEPTYLGGKWGLDVNNGSARMFLSRNTDNTKFIYKDITVFKKAVSGLSGKTVSVMSLGDSLTQGIDWKNIPVCMLSDELAKIGVTTRFIGSLARTLYNKQGQSVKLNFEGRGGWRYRTLTGLESQFAGLNVVIPSSQTKNEWVLGVDGSDMNTIKANNAFLYPATDEDKANYPEFCYHFVEGNSGYNTSYAEDATLGDYVIFNPTKYFSMRNIEIPDILTIAFGTNEWYLGNFDLPQASKAFRFIVEQFRKASSTMKIVVIPSNALNLGRQDSWEREAAVLTSEVIKVTDELISAGDNNLFVCPIYANCSRWLAWDKLTDAPSNITSNNDTKMATISNDVHSFYVDDESNNQYADSLTACIVNLIE